MDEDRDLDILADIPPGPRHAPCAVRRLRETDPRLAEQFDRAVGAKLSSGRVASWFAQRGHPEISDQVYRRHLNEGCTGCRTTS